jgi:hypothetical protein
MDWSKGPDGAASCTAGPFSLKITPKGDGRWNWQVFREGIANAVASGVAASLGAARTATEQFAKRSGLL